MDKVRQASCAATSDLELTMTRYPLVDKVALNANPKPRFAPVTIAVGRQGSVRASIFSGKKSIPRLRSCVPEEGV